MQKASNRIITISPSSQLRKKEDQAKNGNLGLKEKPKLQKSEKTKSIKYVDRINKNYNDLNKSLTPIKPSQSSKHTRTSTSLKTASKFNPNLHEDLNDFQQESQIQNELASSYSIVSEYSSSNLNKFSKFNKNPENKKQDFGDLCNIRQKNGNKIEGINDYLNKIQNSNYQSLPYNNPSICLQKKMQIDRLRNLLGNGKKYIIKQSQQFQNLQNYQSLSSFQTNLSQIENIELLKSTLTKQISSICKNIHELVDKKQQQLMNNLEQSLFEFKQKQLNKVYRMDGLKTFIEKCEADIDKNYQQVVQQLEIDKFREVINKYIKRFKYHFQKLKTNYSIKVDYPQKMSQDINVILQKISINIQAEQNDLNCSPKIIKQERTISEIYPKHQRFSNPLTKSNLVINLKMGNKQMEVEQPPQIFSSRNA